MTPLALKITNQLHLPLRDRTFHDRGQLLRQMDDVHCFDVTEVLPLIDDFAGVHFFDNFDEKVAFLPAPKTWIEFENGGLRSGALLVQVGDAVDVTTAAWDREIDEFMSFDEPLAITLPKFDFLAKDLKFASTISTTLYGALVLINSPRFIGRVQHHPHRGLESKLARAKGLVGKFPLHAWTELKLRVSDINSPPDGQVHEHHYTGEKCLHFCRSHLRVKLGRLEMVTSHWRGNPALGIKRTRYTLVP